MGKVQGAKKKAILLETARIGKRGTTSFGSRTPDHYKKKKRENYPTQDDSEGKKETLGNEEGGQIKKIRSLCSREVVGIPLGPNPSLVPVRYRREIGFCIVSPWSTHPGSIENYFQSLFSQSFGELGPPD